MINAVASSKVKKMYSVHQGFVNIDPHQTSKDYFVSRMEEAAKQAYESKYLSSKAGGASRNHMLANSSAPVDHFDEGSSAQGSLIGFGNLAHQQSYMDTHGLQT